VCIYETVTGTRLAWRVATQQAGERTVETVVSCGHGQVGQHKQPAPLKFPNHTSFRSTRHETTHMKSSRAIYTNTEKPIRSDPRAHTSFQPRLMIMAYAATYSRSSTSSTDKQRHHTCIDTQIYTRYTMPCKDGKTICADVTAVICRPRSGSGLGGGTSSHALLHYKVTRRIFTEL